MNKYRAPRFNQCSTGLFVSCLVKKPNYMKNILHCILGGKLGQCKCICKISEFDDPDEENVTIQFDNGDIKILSLDQVKIKNIFE